MISGKITVFTPFQIGILSLFGTVATGFVAMVVNYRTLGFTRMAIRTAMIGILLVGTVLALFAVIPTTPIDRYMPLVMAPIMSSAAHLTQGKLIGEIISKGGHRKTVWPLILTVFFTLLVLGAILIILFSIHWLTPKPN